MNKNTLEEVKKHILKNKITNKDKEVITSLFFSYDEIYPDNIDYMIVFGNNNLYRIKEAINLYKKRPCKMILSGGNLVDKNIKECEYFYKYALSNNISSNDLICEENSHNTIENIRYSFKLINKKENVRLLIVSSTQHLYRISRMILLISKQLNFYPKCYYYPVYPSGYIKDKWCLDKDICKEIALEIDKIIHYDLIS